MSHESPHGGQKVGWFELFYDLVIVAAVSQAGKVFVKEPTGESAVLIGAALLALFTVWLLTTLDYGLFPAEVLSRRAVLVVQMFAVVVAALGLGSHGLPGPVSHAALSLVFAAIALVYLLQARAGGPLSAPARVVGTSAAVAAVAFAVNAVAFTGLDDATVAVVGPVVLMAAVVVIGVPLLGWVLPRIAGSIDLEHLEERFGLLVIIVLGESFINLIGSLGVLGTIPSPLFFALTFLVAYSTWSIYFTSIQAYRMPTSVSGLRVWIAGHALLVVSVVAVAVQFTDLTLHGSGPSAGFDGHWTTLPMLGVVGALALLAWRARHVPRGMVGTHVAALAVLAVAYLAEVITGAGGSEWPTLVAALVVIGDALACIVVRRRQAIAWPGVSWPG